MTISRARRIAQLLGSGEKIQEQFLDSDSVVETGNRGATPTVTGRVTVYSASTALPTTADAGELAFVTSTNKFYLSSGTGWYTIATVNNSPYWVTQPSATYDYSSGTANFTIEIEAGDSEDVPLTFTATADSDFLNIATISIDSESTTLNQIRYLVQFDSENIDSEDAGSGDVVFNVTDGVNSLSVTSVFSMAFFNGVNGSNYGYYGLNTGSSGARAPGGDNSGIQRTPFASDSPFTGFASPHHYRAYASGGGNSASYGYLNSGKHPSRSPSWSDGTGEKYPFAVGGDATKIVDFDTYPKANFGWGSATVCHSDRYFICGGGNGYPQYGAPYPTSHATNISYITFSNDAATWDAGSLSKARDSSFSGGQSATTGYMIGGRQPTHVLLNDFDKFPKASGYTATLMGSIGPSYQKEGSMTYSAPDALYNVGGSSGPTASKYTVMVMPHSTESWSSTGWSLNPGNGTAYKCGLNSDTKAYKIAGAPYDQVHTTTVFPFASVAPSSGTIANGSLTFAGYNSAPQYSAFQSYGNHSHFS